MNDLKDFDQARVLIVGDVMLDRYWWGTVDRISPEAPVPVVRLERTSTTPGGAANVAVNVAALGGKAFLIGCVGDDAEAGEIRRSLYERGVSPNNLFAGDSKCTTVKTRIVAHGQHVVRIDSEDVIAIDEDQSQQICEAISSVLPQVETVVISDYAKGLLSPRVLNHLIESCRAGSKRLLVDPKGKDFSKYNGASILTPNRHEAAEACKLDHSTPNVVEIAGKTLLTEFNFENVLITEGENGMTLFSRSDTLHVDAVAHQVFDVTGAGDTVIATLAVAIAAGCDLVTAVKFANTAAGIAVGKVGTSAVTVEMIRENQHLFMAVTPD